MTSLTDSGPQGAGVLRLAGVDQAVGVGVEPLEQGTRAEELAGREVAVAVAVHVPEPRGTLPGLSWSCDRAAARVGTDGEPERHRGLREGPLEPMGNLGDGDLAVAVAVVSGQPLAR